MMQNMMQMLEQLGMGSNPTISSNSFTGQDEMADALMALNQGGPDTTGPGGGMMPGMTANSASFGGVNAPSTPSIEADEMQIQQRPDSGGSIAGNIAKLMMGFG